MQRFRKSTISEITDSRRLHQNPYAYLDSVGSFDAISLNYETKKQLHASPYKKPSNNKSITTVEQKVQDLHKTIWKKRHALWPEGVPSDPVELLDPKFALEYLDYDLEMSEYLGEYYSHDSSIEAAGILDRTAKRISISNRLPKDTLRFTTAHELGHVILHNQTMMHRDRAIDGTNPKNIPREPIEFEADKFAALFLMPEKLVRQRFRLTFGLDKFVLTEDTAFALDPKKSIDQFRKDNNPHNLARILAETSYYNGNQINSLASQFKVSVGAMAIRIKELNLI